ncbi:hypothetical protein RhiJN_04581 [Ceratobasidium sp. AG-Ba]|nr:hypothetical protein RhiJN_04581 [Ceratobasidium sp. AG-Ba]
MDPNSIEGRYATQLIAQLEGVLAKAVGQERQRWAEPFQELQQKILELRSENVRLNVQIQSHQLESTNRALWHKRKAESDVLDSRPAKFPRQQNAVSQGFAPPTPSSSRALSADLDDEVEGTHPQPHSDLAQSTGRVNDGGATRELVPRRRDRPDDLSHPSLDEHADLMLPCHLSPKMKRSVCFIAYVFHAGCVNLKEVPSEAEEWHCPACIGSLNEPSMVPSRQFTTAAIQTATGCTRIDSSCQTDSEPEARISSPSINPEKRIPSLAILPSEPLILSPFAPQSVLATKPPRDGTPPELISPGVTPTSLSTPVIEMPITPGQDVSTGFSCGKDAVLIQVPKKLIESSRPSLFRMLQPTARKPWTDDLDTS